MTFGSNLSIDNIVQLGSTDTKIVSQDAVKKVLELTEKWKYPIFTGKCFFFRNLLDCSDKSIQSLDIHDSSAFYSTL